MSSLEIRWLERRVTMKRKALIIILIVVVSCFSYVLWKFRVFEWSAGVLVSLSTLFSR